LEYEHHGTYLAYIAARSKYTATSDSFTFSNYYFKGLERGDTCDLWKNYKDNALSLPFDDIKFLKVTLRVDSYDFDTNTNRTVLATCASPGLIQPLITSLRTGDAVEINCNDRTWRVFSCGTRVIFCVNCKRVCVDSETCPGKALVVNPCSACKAHTAASTVVNFQYGLLKLYPQFSLPLKVTQTSLPTSFNLSAGFKLSCLYIQIAPGKTYIDVTMNVTTAGNVYCAALAPTAALKNVLDMKTAGASTIVAPAQTTASLRIPSLSPSSAYTVYCASDDFAAHVMTLEDARLTATAVTTACCRSITLGNVPISIPQYFATNARAENYFTVTLDSAPAGGAIVSLTVLQVKCTPNAGTLGTTDAALLPSTFTFTATSQSLTGTFVLRTTVLGCYRISATAAGATRYTAANATLVVASFRSPPPLPLLSTVALSNKGNAVLFTFESSTDRGADKVPNFATVFPCSSLVYFPGSNVTNCKWLDSSTLEGAYNLNAVKPSVGDTATLFAGKLRAVCVDKTPCETYPYLPQVTKRIAAPVAPLTPTAVVITLSTIAICDDVVLDPTPSRGAAGRDWAAVEWFVAPAGTPGLARNASDIQAYLNAHFRMTTSVARVPNYFLTPSNRYFPSAYDFSLRVTNFLQQSSVVKVNVLVGNGIGQTLPQIQMFGGNVQTYRWKPLTLFATATFPGCVQNTSSLPLYFSWKVYDGLTYVPSITSTSSDQRYFKLIPYALDANKVYTVSVDVSYVPGGVAAKSLGFASSKVWTGQSGVTAVIGGGPSRVVGALAPVVLDASSSVDVDYPTQSSQLSYVWSCQQFTPTFGAACPGFTSSTASMLTVPAGTFTSAVVYNVTVTVANTASASSTASVLVSVAAAAIPTVSVARAAIKYNPEDKITLTGTVSAAQGPATLTWSSPSIAGFSVSSIPASPVTKAVGVGTWTFQLALGANRLQSGVAYTFRLDAAYTASPAATGFSTVTVVMNEPPAGGVLRVTPSAGGTALSTMFDIRSTGWADDEADFPLSYLISSYQLNPGMLNPLKGLDTVPFVSTVLGQGLSSMNYIVYCAVTAQDVYGGRANATTSTTARPPVSTTAVVTATRTSIATALTNLDATSVVTAVNAALTSLNSVLCNVPTPCASLNRENCQATQNTCGACLPGYVGAYGDSNVNCAALSVVKKVGATCSSDEVCVTGKCTSGVCADVDKTCVDDCSGFGTCAFVDLEGKPVTKCTITDSRCTAQCVCQADRYGSTCAFRQAAYKQVLSFRETLCVGILRSLPLQDVTVDTISARAVSVSNILIDIDQISSAALGNCTAALIATVKSAPQLACAPTVIGVISGAFSSILAKGRAIAPSLLSEVLTTMLSLTGGCQGLSTPGEPPLVLETPNMKILTSLVSADEVKDEVFVPPQSALEVANQQPAASMQVTDLSDASVSSLGVSVVVLKNNPRGLETQSSRLGFGFRSYVDAGATRRLTESSADGIGFTMVLQNNEHTIYDNTYVRNLTFRCFRPYQADPYELRGVCPGGQELTYVCPSWTKRTYNVSCPAHVTFPSCTMYDGSDFEVAPKCSAIAYTAYNTTCLCYAGSGSDNSRRALQTSSTTGLQEFSTTLSEYRTEYRETYYDAPALADVRSTTAVSGTFAGVLAIYFAGLIALVFWDRTLRDDKMKYKELAPPAPKVKVRTVNVFFDQLFPDEFRRGPWYAKLWRRLLLEHPILRVLAPSEYPLDCATHWTSLLGSLLVLLFVNSMVAKHMYADDGACENIIEQDECKARRMAGAVFHTCQWRTDNEACAFRPPDDSFRVVIMLSLIVAVTSVPLDKVWQWSTEQAAAFLRYHRSAATVTTEAVVVPIRTRNDEFSDVQTKHSKLLRAARLAKIQQHGDFVTPAAEGQMVMKRLQEETLLMKFRTFYDVASTVSLARMRYGVTPASKRNTEAALTRAREDAARIRKETVVIDGSELQEQNLMRHFIVELFAGHEKYIARRFFFPQCPSGERTQRELAAQCLGLLLLPTYFIVLIYYIFQFSLSLGSRSGSLWLLTVLTVFLQRYFLVDPGRIWLSWVVVNASVEQDARTFCESLSRRARLILSRRTGVVTNYNDAVQHFNPACRAARMFPALPVSRLLFSVNDCDVMLSTVPRSHWLYRHTVAVLLHALYANPVHVQEAALTIVTVLVIDFGFLALYYSNTVSPALVTFFVLALVGLALYVCWEEALLLFKFALSRVRRKFAIEPVLHEFDFEDEASFQPEPVTTAKSSKGFKAKGAPTPTRSGMFTEVYSTKLQSGKARVVKKRAYPFKPFSDMYQMNRRYGVENLLDKDVTFIGTVGENEEEYEEAVQSVKLKLTLLRVKEENEEKSEQQAPSTNSSYLNLTALQAIPEEHALADSIGFDDADCDVISVLSGVSQGTSAHGSPLRATAGIAESKLGEDTASVGAGSARSIRTASSRHTSIMKNTASNRFSWKGASIRADASAEYKPLASPAGSVAAVRVPATSSFLSMPQSPDISESGSFSFVRDAKARASNGTAAAAPSRATARFDSPLRPTAGTIPSRYPRNTNTQSLRYKRYADRAPRYTDVPVAGPGGAAAVSLDEIKEEHTGVASPTPANRHNQTPAYFVRARTKKHRHASSDVSEANQLGPGRILVAHELNELPSFPLMY
jgi:hypothetical protein